jgi:hypothetical protein
MKKVIRNKKKTTIDIFGREKAQKAVVGHFVLAIII